MWTANRNTNLKRRSFLGVSAAALVSLAVLVATPAHADQLDDLRASGALGEAFDGFTRARDASAKDFSSSINGKRRKIYIKRAKSEGISVDQVGSVYAAQIAKKAPDGTWMLSASGEWSRK